MQMHGIVTRRGNMANSPAFRKGVSYLASNLDIKMSRLESKAEEFYSIYSRGLSGGGS